MQLRNGFHGPPWITLWLFLIPVALIRHLYLSLVMIPSLAAIEAKHLHQAIKGLPVPADIAVGVVSALTLVLVHSADCGVSAHLQLLHGMHAHFGGQKVPIHRLICPQEWSRKRPCLDSPKLVPIQSLNPNGILIPTPSTPATSPFALLRPLLSIPSPGPRRQQIPSHST